MKMMIIDKFTQNMILNSLLQSSCDRRCVHGHLVTDVTNAQLTPREIHFYQIQGQLERWSNHSPGLL